MKYFFRKAVLSGLLGYLLATPTSAQRISVANYAGLFCPESPVFIAVNADFTLSAANGVIIEYTDYSQTAPIRQLPATLMSSSRLSFRFPASEEFPGSSSAFSFRVVTANPSAQSAWFQATFYKKAKVTLETKQVDAGFNDLVPVQLNLSGTWPIDLVLGDRMSGDSLVFSFSENSWNQVFRDKIIRLAADRSREYFVRSVSNICGVGTGTGKLSVSLPPLTVKQTTVTPAVVCPGQPAWITYATSGGAFTPASTFTVRLDREDPGNGTLKPAGVVDGIADNGNIRFLIPEGFLPGRYAVHLRSENPATIAQETPGRPMFLTLAEPPSVRFSSHEIRTIGFGEEASVGVSFRGAPPYVAALQDNTHIGYDYSDTFVQVRPEVTTSYRLKSFSSGCGTATPSPDSLTVIVEKGISIDSLPSGLLCVGKIVDLPIRANFDASGTVMVYLHSMGDRLSAQGQIRNSHLVFTIPAVPDNLTGESFQLEVKGDQFHYFSRENIYAGALPTIRQQPGDTLHSFSYASYNYKSLQVGGGGPYSITFDDGYAYESSGNSVAFVFPALKRTSYRITSVRNACGTVPADIRFTEVIRDEPERGLAVLPFRENNCADQPFTLAFQAKGVFGAANKFRAVYEVNGKTTTLGEAAGTQSGILTFKLPLVTTGASGSVRVESTDPVIKSQTRSLQIAPQPSGGLAGFTPSEYLPGETVKLNFAENSVFSRATLTDGQRTYSTGLYSSYLPYRVSSPGTVRLLAVSNGCGVKQVTDAAVDVKPLRAKFHWTKPVLYLCPNTTLVLPYAIQGTVDAETDFDVLISTDGEMNYSTLARNVKGNPIRLTLPSFSISQTIYIRVKSAKNGITSAPLSLFVPALPSARITTENGETVLKEYDGFFTARFNIQGASPYNIALSDGTGLFSDTQSAYQQLSPARGQTYTIKTVSDACGYGSGSGQINVQVKPAISVTGVTPQLCQGDKFRVDYQSLGDFPKGERFRLILLDQNEVRITPLDSGRQAGGSLEGVLPAQLLPGRYYVSVESVLADLSSNRTEINIQATPAVSLASDVSVVAGQQTVLRVTNRRQTPLSDELIHFRLSDGQEGTFLASERYHDVIVSPAATTTYRISSVSGLCGEGQAFGSATVTIENPTAKALLVNAVRASARFEGICAGDSLQVDVSAIGTLSSSASYQIQLSDTLGSNYRNLPTAGRFPNFRALVPSGQPPADVYRIKVVSTEAGVRSQPHTVPLLLRERPTASFAQEVLYNPPHTLKPIVVNLTGGGPWQYVIGGDAYPMTYCSSESARASFLPVNLSHIPTVFKLYSVANVCGSGTIGNPSTLRIDVLTSVENPGGSLTRVFPNPSSDWLRVEFGNAATRTLSLLTEDGRKVAAVHSDKDAEQLDIRSLPAGTYLLRIERASFSELFRIVKQ